MQFKVILLSAIMALGFTSTVTATFDANFCTPSVNQNTCVLTFQTGGDIIVEENGQPSIGEVNIYSPSCNLWGSKVLYSSNPTSILAWGLSFKNPVLFIPVYVPGVGYGQPKFEYEGDEYGPGDCDCVLNATDGSHECLCRFACIPFLIDSVAMVDPKMG
ncbi:hypothetical protein L207DRAFT_584701 [Hyaloscypha variabilis F]|uniref:Uncharacterized protein n=1 Tax=Hyaloscypha variabilis (strain UAMH 11265 / GT02V1 / F) TaxID=1149755 RepID=A0A2J6RLD6_HYAVF|nr:hypothetical protein L207DRAFT_584701 [Hyaloscypha variabilis F]